MRAPRRTAEPGDDLLQRVRALGRAAELSEGRVDAEAVAEAARVVAQVDRRLGLSGDSTVVALAGATGSGKSSLFNVLSGTRLAEVGVRRPTTAVPLAAHWGEHPSAADLLDWLQVGRRHGIGTAYGPADLDGLVLLDLPDHDSTEVGHRIQVDRLVPLVDVLVWVVDPQKYADAALHDRYLRPLVGHADVMLVVLNHADTLTEDDRERCLADLRQLLESEGLGRVGVLAVSAETGSGLGRVAYPTGSRGRRQAGRDPPADRRRRTGRPPVDRGVGYRCVAGPGPQQCRQVERRPR